MAKRRSAKSAFLSSAVAMVMSFTMLLGTTFAWFTDSVTSANNIITAGNLDVELYHSDSKVTDEKVTSTTKLFDDVDSAKWEPGAMAWEKFTVKNEGSLDLKYNLTLNALNATVIDNVSFASMLKVAIVDESFTYTRENVQAIPASEWSTLRTFSTAGELLDGESDVQGVVIYWQPSALDNMFNMNNGKPAGSVHVEVGVTLMATQLTNEEDSFGKDYDKDAPWMGGADTTWYEADKTEFTLDTAEDLAGLAQIVNSGTDTFEKNTVTLAADINLNNVLWSPIGVSGHKFGGSFKGEGHTISNLKVIGSKGVGLFGYTLAGTHIENLNVVNAYVSGNDYVGTILGNGYLSTNCIRNCTVENATVLATPYIKDNGEYDGGAKAGVIAGFAVNGHIVGNTAKNSTVTAYRDLGGIVGWLNGENHPVHASANKVENVTLNFVGVAGAYDGNKTNENMNEIVGRQGSNVTVATDNVASNVTKNDQNEGAVMIFTLDELTKFAASVNAGNSYEEKTVILGADIDLCNMTWTPIGTNATPFNGTFDGNGKTVSNLNVVGSNNAGFFGYADGAAIQNLTINNASVEGTDCVGAIAGQVYSVSTVDNCHVTGKIQVLGQTYVGGIVGKYYTKVTNCSVIGAESSDSFVKGVFVESDLEGDNVGGIMGHCGENNNISGNTVKNITVSGTRKVGGIVGIADQNTEVNNNTVENVLVETTATAEYAQSNVKTMSISALIGQYQTAGSNPDGTVVGNTINNVRFANANNVTVSIGALTGGARGGSNGTIAPSEAIKVVNNVVENVEGTNNNYFYSAAVNGKSYLTTADAIANAQSGSTIELLRTEQVSETISVAAGKELTIDLNEKSIIGTTVKPAHVLNNEGTLTIKGGTISSTAPNGGSAVYNNGTLTVENATLNGSAIREGEGWPSYPVNNYGDLTITACTVNGYQGGISNAAGAKAVVNNVTIVKNYLNTSSHTFYNSGDLTINGGIYSHNGMDGSLIYSYGTSNVTINDGTFSASAGGYGPAIYKGTITINGGDFSNCTLIDWGGSATIKGGTFKTAPASKFIAEGYKATQSGSVWVVTAEDTNPANNADALVESLENGKDVFFTDDIAMSTPSTTNGYGAAGISVGNGQTIDGNGKEFSVNAWTTWDSAINTTGGLIKNIKITGGMRGIFVNHNSTYSDKVILENVIIDGTVYTISCDQGTGKGLEATNSTFNGWTSYATTLGNVKFNNCNFGEGQGYAFCQPYAPTEFIGCDFEAGYGINPLAAVTFKNCTIGGVALTAENLSTLVVGNLANASVIA